MQVVRFRQKIVVEKLVDALREEVSCNSNSQSSSAGNRNKHVVITYN